MNGLCLEGRVLEALALVNKMVENGHKRIAVTNGTIANGMCKMGDTVSALNMLKKIEGNHIKASVYNVIIDLLSPEVFTYNCMVDACCSSSNGVMPTDFCVI